MFTRFRKILTKKVREQFDEDYEKELAHYFGQPLLVLASLIILMGSFGFLGKEVIVAALGSSAFVAFCMPENYTSRVRNLVGSHFLAGLIGIGFSFMLHEFGFNYFLYIFLVASAVSLATFFMIITQTEHPPAAGTALGLAMGEGSWMAFAFLMVSMIGLALIKKGLSNWLIDLV